MLYMSETYYEGSKIRYTVTGSSHALLTAIICFGCGVFMSGLDIYYYVNDGRPEGADELFAFYLITGLAVFFFLGAVIYGMIYRNRRLYVLEQDVYLYRSMFGRETRFTRHEIVVATKSFNLSREVSITVTGHVGTVFCRLESNMPGYNIFTKEMEAYGFCTSYNNLKRPFAGDAIRTLGTEMLIREEERRLNAMTDDDFRRVTDHVSALKTWSRIIQIVTVICGILIMYTRIVIDVWMLNLMSVLMPINLALLIVGRSYFTCYKRTASLMEGRSERFLDTRVDAPVGGLVFANMIWIRSAALYIRGYEETVLGLCVILGVILCAVTLRVFGYKMTLGTALLFSPWLFFAAYGLAGRIIVLLLYV